MTDQEYVLAMFQRAGVRYELGGDSESYSWISAEAGNGEANQGYTGFVTQMEFYPDGRLRSIGAWE